MAESTQHSPPNDTEINSGEISIIDFALLLAENIKLLILAPLLAGIVTLASTYLIKPTFTATAQIMAPQSQGAASALLGSLGGLAAFAGGGLGGIKNQTDQWISLMTSRTVAENLLEKFNLQEAYATKYRFQAWEELAKNTKISAGKDGLIDIEVEDKDPNRAAALTQAYITELERMTKNLALSEASQRRLFFEKQLGEVKTNLIKAEIALKESGVNASILKTSPDAAVGPLAQLQAQATAAEIQISVLRQSQTNNSPILRGAIGQLESLRSQIRRLEQNDPAASTSAGTEYVSKYREFKYQETLFEMMARQYELARADESRDSSTVQIIDAPQAPEYKTKPKRGFITISGMMAALAISILYLVTKQSIQQYQKIPSQAATWKKLRSTLGLNDKY